MTCCSSSSAGMSASTSMASSASSSSSRSCSEAGKAGFLVTSFWISAEVIRPGFSCNSIHATELMSVKLLLHFLNATSRSRGKASFLVSTLNLSWPCRVRPEDLAVELAVEAEVALIVNTHGWRGVWNVEHLAYDTPVLSRSFQARENRSAGATSLVRKDPFLLKLKRMDGCDSKAVLEYKSHI